MVVCIDVLEHIEPDCLDDVLADIRRPMLKAAFLIVGTRLDGSSTLLGGRDPHFIVDPPEWWIARVQPGWSDCEGRLTDREVKFRCLT